MLTTKTECESPAQIIIKTISELLKKLLCSVCKPNLIKFNSVWTFYCFSV